VDSHAEGPVSAGDVIRVFYVLEPLEAPFHMPEAGSTVDAGSIDEYAVTHEEEVSDLRRFVKRQLKVRSR